MSGDIDTALTALVAAVSAVQNLDRVQCTPAELLAVSRLVQEQISALVWADAQVVAELDSRKVAHEFGARDTRALLMQQLRLAPAEASQRVRLAKQVGSRTAVTGEQLEPICPQASAALKAGEISVGQVQIIARTLQAIPAQVEQDYLQDGVQLLDQLETDLVELARTVDTRALGVHAQAVMAYFDPDGTLATEEEKQRRRTLDLHVRPDGTGRLTGDLTPEAAQAWTTILDALSKPAPETDDLPDRRTATQRRHDGFLDAAHRLLRSGTLPDCGGVPVSIIITMTADQAATGRGYATTEHGDHIPAATALRMGDQAEIITTILNSTGGITSYGTTRRLATPAMRRALTARDGGCSFPGCTAPATWSQVHHVIPWQHGGRTDLNNLTLVCGHHHRTFQKHGWTCRMRDGRPEWTPPPWLDPHQQPRRNTTVHHQHALHEAAPT